MTTDLLTTRLLTFLVTLALSAAAGATVTDESTATDSTREALKALAPLPEHGPTTRNVVDALAGRHYVNTRLDDGLSAKILEEFMEDLDPTRSYLLAGDVAEFERYRFELDNALRRGDLDPAFTMFNRYHERVVERFEQIIVMLEAGIDQFDFTVDEDLDLDREDHPWATKSAELDELWRKRVKHAVLNLQLAEKEDDKIAELLLKRYRTRLARTLQTNSNDVYQLYMNSFTRTYDPHTQYFSPRTSENFNINMSLSLEGIGAVLQREDEYTKVVSLVPAGPADKSKQLFPDDKIVAVGQGDDGEMVDVIGWRLDEVVQLIRGKKDTIVRLDVEPANPTGDAGNKVVHITRNTVKLEEQSAKSEIIEIEQFGHTRKIGVIDIPTFYIDFRALQQGDKYYKSTTRDVKKLLYGLMDDGVDGIVIDLRDNGGGSLQEANTLTGLFIDRGPTVQIRSKNDRVDILNDRDIRTIYDGPLAVMVNRLSASASEIFAGAIQDYQRGVIIGSQTFGKGTVQSLIPLNFGQLKLTQAKFYRISGESTQHEGIMPDIAYPANYDPESIGESTLEDPLPWDRIRPAGYRTRDNLVQLLPELRSLHDQRVATDAEFDYLRAAFEYRARQSKDTSISLNKATRLAEKDASDDFWLALENRRRTAQGLDAVASLDALTETDSATAQATEAAQAGASPGVDSAASGGPTGTTNEGIITGEVAVEEVTPTESVAANDEAEEAKPDAFLIESGHILLDLITLQGRTAKKVSHDNRI